MPRLEVSSRAQRDIDELFQFGIPHYGVRYTDNYVRQLRERIRQLQQFPLLGVARPDVRPDIRLLVFKARNVPYRVIGDIVLIVRVLHRSANWASLV
jgi:toxin ParE1/3/4